MIKSVLKIFGSFFQRMQNDHMGAYAATCAYFIMISFVPFFMIFIAFADGLNADVSALTGGFMAIIPSGLKVYVSAVINEISSKSYAYVPLSVIVLVWSASKVFHALTNGLNVISRAQETRGWFYLRFRSMFFVILFFVFAGVALVLSVFGQSIQDSLKTSFPKLEEILQFFFYFRTLFGYFGLILAFLFVYKFLPNCRYTFRSQFPGALLVATIWVFVSYLLSLYYEHNKNFNETYGSMTGMVLAMIWLYFCAYFILFGAELNRVIYEDPEDNIIVNTLDAVKDASARKQQEIAEELNEHSLWRPLDDEDGELPAWQPKDIEISWADDDEEVVRSAVLAREALLRKGRMPRISPEEESVRNQENGDEEYKGPVYRPVDKGGWTAGAVRKK